MSMLGSARLLENGRLTVPAHIRSELDLNPGDTVVIEVIPLTRDALETDQVEDIYEDCL